MADPHLDLLDAARHADAVEARTRRRLLDEVDERDATFVTSLHAAAEAGGTVLIDTTVGRTVRGRMEAVGEEHVVVTAPSATSFVRIDQVTALRPVAGAPPIRATAGSDARPPAGSLTDELVELARQRDGVDVHLVGGAVVRGAVRRVGDDVLTVGDPASGDEVLVQLALAAVIVVPRGAA